MDILAKSCPCEPSDDPLSLLCPMQAQEPRGAQEPLQAQEPLDHPLSLAEKRILGGQYKGAR